MRHETGAIGRGLTALAAAALLAALGAGPAWAQPLQAAKPEPTKAVQGPDTLIMRNGTVLTGKILSETPSSLKFSGLSHGIAYESEFQKADILEIKRGALAEAPAAPSADPGATPKAGDPKPAPPAQDKKIVYLIDLEGKFGEDITQTPLRGAIRDARKQNAEYIIIRLNNDWRAEGDFEDLPDDAAAFDELFRAEDLMPVFMTDLPKEWEGQKPPQVVFLVEQAMGGACFLPMICPTIYFTPEARMGGVGNLTRLFGSTGDELVRQKQYSLRLAHAEGWANVGGYDYRLLGALCRTEDVLSVSFEGGRPVYHARMPETPGELLLTDDGKEINEDNIEALARGEGNDVLTLNAKLAQDLLVSKGTCRNVDEVIDALGIARSADKTYGRSKQIMEGWTESVRQAKKNIIRLLQEFTDIQVAGEYPARTKARGQKIRKIQEVISILERYDESLTGRWRGQNGIPGLDQLLLIIEQLRVQQMADKP